MLIWRGGLEQAVEQGGCGGGGGGGDDGFPTGFIPHGFRSSGTCRMANDAGARVRPASPSRRPTEAEKKETSATAAKCEGPSAGEVRFIQRHFCNGLFV